MPGASTNIGRPWQKLQTLKNYSCLLNFRLFVSIIGHLFEGGKNIFFPKIFILLPIGLWCPGRPQNSTPPPSPSCAIGCNMERTGNIHVHSSSAYASPSVWFRILQTDSRKRKQKTVSSSSRAVPLGHRPNMFIARFSFHLPSGSLMNCGNTEGD